MDLRTEISEFIRSRRARITPEQAGLRPGGTRRVPGLRREEVAVFASISVDWYVRIERGNLAGVSDEVLDALAVALCLDDAETSHLFDLARAVHRTSRRPTVRDPNPAVGQGLQTILDSLQGLPAWARNHRFEMLATNPLGRALYADLLRSQVADGNTARFTFLDEASRDFFLDWEQAANDVVAVLRGYVGANPTDRRLSNLVGQLATQSPEFTRRWAARDVKYHRTGRKRLHHRAVGDLALAFEALAPPHQPTLNLFVYHPVDEPTRERLRLLESWSATEAAESGTPTTPRTSTVD